MLLEPGEMVSASFINHHEVGSKSNDAAEDNDPEVATDIILMRKCLSTACQKRKGRMHGRGVWAKSDYWLTTSIIVLATLFLILTCIVSFYRSQFVKLCIVRNFVVTEKKQGALYDGCAEWLSKGNTEVLLNVVYKNSCFYKPLNILKSKMPLEHTVG